MSDRILVIDDSPETHALLKARLSREPVVIHSALDAQTGLAAAHELCPSLILLDLEMPGQDGFSVCAELKADPDTQDIPVIFLTGETSTENKVRGLELGAADYVTKPFDPAELKARVRASLRTRSLIDLLSRKAMVDGLTELWNRSYFDARLAIELSNARRSGERLSCIMADVDRFKGINDSYGHAFGDQALQLIASVFAECTRPGDIACRFGGEEFAILLPRTSLEQAAVIAERLRLAIEARPLAYHGKPVGITCSFGVAELRDPIPPSLVELADDALYRAKDLGRNQVAVAPGQEA